MQNGQFTISSIEYSSQLSSFVKSCRNNIFGCDQFNQVKAYEIKKN